MKKIDETAYQSGRKIFDKGKSLRSVVDEMVAHANGPQTEAERALTSEELSAKENAMMSRLLGFADAFLDRVRNIRR